MCEDLRVYKYIKVGTKQANPVCIDLYNVANINLMIWLYLGKEGNVSLAELCITQLQNGTNSYSTHL